MTHPSSVLFVSNIPHTSNSIPILARHFQRYGTVTAVSCAGTTATVMFETLDEARRAVESPLAFAHNRFVKIQYHRSPEDCAADLQALCDLTAVRLAVGKFNAELERDAMQIALRKEQTKDPSDVLATKLDAMLREAERLMSEYDEASGKRRTALKKQLEEISGMIDESQAELEAMTS
jgi:hypothetical protein